MGDRSDVHVVDQPFPVVFHAFQAALPTVGFRITRVDEARGRLELESRNTRYVLAVGAIDAITTEWVATAELKLGMFRARHRDRFREIRDALDRYLAAYYA